MTRHGFSTSGRTDSRQPEIGLSHPFGARSQVGARCRAFDKFQQEPWREFAADWREVDIELSNWRSIAAVANRSRISREMHVLTAQRAAPVGRERVADRPRVSENVSTD